MALASSSADFGPSVQQVSNTELGGSVDCLRGPVSSYHLAELGLWWNVQSSFLPNVFLLIVMATGI